MKELKNTVVHLPTQEEFSEYMKMCEKVEWNTRQISFGHNKSKTCVEIERFMHFGALSYYKKRDYKIITLKQLKEMNKEELSGSEALYGFCGWLTTQEKKTVMSNVDDAGGIACLVAEFCKVNNLSEPNNHWEKNLIHPSDLSTTKGDREIEHVEIGFLGGIFDKNIPTISVDPAKENSDTSVTSIHHKGELPQYLLDAIEKYNNEPKKRTPDDGKLYYSINGRGGICANKADGMSIDINCFNQNNFFSTEKEARMHSLRIQGMGVKNTAKRGEAFYVWHYGDKEVHLYNSKDSFEAFLMEPKFKTKEEAENWGEKYSDAFKFFNK